MSLLGASKEGNIPLANLSTDHIESEEVGGLSLLGVGIEGNVSGKPCPQLTWGHIHLRHGCGVHA